MVWYSKMVLLQCVVCIFFAGCTAAGHRPDKRKRISFAWNQRTLILFLIQQTVKTPLGILYARHLTACSGVMKILTLRKKEWPDCVNNLVIQLCTDGQQIDITISVQRLVPAQNMQALSYRPMNIFWLCARRHFWQQSQRRKASSAFTQTCHVCCTYLRTAAGEDIQNAIINWMTAEVVQSCL